MMSRKHYIEIAKTLSESKRIYGMSAQWVDLVDQLCIILKKDNTLFDKVRFMQKINEKN